MIFVSVKYKVGSLSEVRLTETGYGGPGDRLFITTLKGTVISTSLVLQYWRHSLHLTILSGVECGVRGGRGTQIF